jgi:hypothetical protein
VAEDPTASPIISSAEPGEAIVGAEDDTFLSGTFSLVLFSRCILVMLRLIDQFS